MVRIYNVELPPEGAAVTFFLPIPKSWSEKKRAEHLGGPHETRPDLSNLLKALEDAVYGDDSHIWQYAGLCKRWGNEGKIVVDIPSH